MGKNYTARTRRDAPIGAFDVLDKVIQRLGGNRAKSRLASLWSDWDEIMGELASLARPLGASGNTLLIRAENSLHMQELQFRSQELLDQANGYLQEPYFTQAHFSIYKGGKNCPPDMAGNDRTGTNEKRRALEKPAPKKSHLTGKYLKDMDESSPVAKCYAAFAKNA